MCKRVKTKQIRQFHQFCVNCSHLSSTFSSNRQMLHQLSSKSPWTIFLTCTATLRTRFHHHLHTDIHGVFYTFSNFICGLNSVKYGTKMKHNLSSVSNYTWKIPSMLATNRFPYRNFTKEKNAEMPKYNYSKGNNATRKWFTILTFSEPQF